MSIDVIDLRDFYSKRLGIVNQIAEIIGQTGEQANFGGHDISVSSGEAQTIGAGSPYPSMKYGVNAD